MWYKSKMLRSFLKLFALQIAFVFEFSDDYSIARINLMAVTCPGPFAGMPL